MMKDVSGTILYIGKANRLRSRVSSYFQKSSQLAPDKQIMVGKIKKIEYIITSSETEALLLESELVKKHQPHYNINLKDDKNFSYIKITVKEDFPRVFSVRRITKDGSKYFGPTVSSSAVKQTLHWLRRLFPHRNFTKAPAGHQLQYLLKRYPELLGPQNKDEYKKTINRIITFLKGNYDDVQRDLREKMTLAANKKDFEKAAEYRDKIRAIDRVIEKQKVISTKNENLDIISVVCEGAIGAINLFTVRNGRLLGKQNFILKNTASQANSALLQAFIKQYYPQVTDTPQQIITGEPIPEKTVIENALKIKIFVPTRGQKRHYIKLGEENASAYIHQQKTSWERDNLRVKRALDDLRRYLKLKSPLRRIEAFDISNIQGETAVGSMVVFTDGVPDKRWYRKFKIKTVQGSNDPAMMAEVVARRFQRTGKSKWPPPDLIILDGGKGQLNIVRKKISLKVPIIAIAKRQEDIYLPGKSAPINIPEKSDALYLIQRIRDEAHRFAISYFRSSHGSKTKRSALDSIPGIGPQRKKILIKKFGSVDAIRQASMAALGNVVGKKQAKIIHEHL